jgi:hypothetical protein
MKKRLILESLTIALLITVMTSTTVFASWPGPDEDNDTDNSLYGSWVKSHVRAYYCDFIPGEPSSTYDCEVYAGSRGSSGAASVYGQMECIWCAGTAWKSYYTSNNVWMAVEWVLCNSAATWTQSEFEYSGLHWYAAAYAYVAASY